MSNEKLHIILSEAIRAPSTHNTQPWLFQIVDGQVDVHIDRSRLLPEADRDGRDCYLSHGCLLESIIIAARASGYDVIYDILPKGDDGPTMRVCFKESQSEKIEKERDLYVELARALRSRYNARGVFVHRVLSEHERAALLQGMDKMDGMARIFSYTDQTTISAMAEIIARAIPVFHSRYSFRQEFSNWMRPNSSQKKDGIYGYSVFASNMMSHILPHVLRTFNMGRFLAMLNRNTVKTSSLIGIVATRNDTKREWIEAGMLLQRLLLGAHTLGLAGSNFASPIEDNTARDAVMRLTPGWLPQLVVAIGKPQRHLPPTPRLPVEMRMLRESSRDALQ